MAIAVAFALYGLPRRALLFAVMALLVRRSRIFVGTHYFTDVLGGGLTGLVAAMLARGFYREESRLDRFATGILDRAGAPPLCDTLRRYLSRVVRLPGVDHDVPGLGLPNRSEDLAAQNGRPPTLASRGRRT